MKKMKYVMMAFGISAIGLGIALLRLALLGTDPFSVLVGGFTLAIGRSFGTTQLLLNVFLFLFQIAVARETIGPGSFANMVFVGYLSDFFLYLLTRIPFTQNMPLSILMLMVAIPIISLGVSLYSKSDLGLAPYDSIGIIMTAKWRIKYQWCRMITDFICVIVGFLLHSSAGVATLLMALGTGPFVEFFNVHVSQPILTGNHYQHRPRRSLILKGIRS